MAKQTIDDCTEDEIWDGSEEMCTTEDYRNMIGDGKVPNRYWVMFSNDEYICKEHDDDGGMHCDGDESIESKGGVVAVFDSFYEARDFVRKFKDFDDTLTIRGETFDVTSKVIEDRLVGMVWEEGVYNYTYTKVVNEREIEERSEERILKKFLEERGQTLR